MKLRKLLRILLPESTVCILDSNGLYLVVEVKDIPKEMKERSVNKLYKSYSHQLLYIELKV